MSDRSVSSKNGTDTPESCPSVSVGGSLTACPARLHAGQTTMNIQLLEVACTTYASTAGPSRRGIVLRHGFGGVAAAALRFTGYRQEGGGRGAR